MPLSLLLFLGQDLSGRPLQTCRGLLSAWTLQLFEELDWIRCPLSTRSVGVPSVPVSWFAYEWQNGKQGQNGNGDNPDREGQQFTRISQERLRGQAHP